MCLIMQEMDIISFPVEIAKIDAKLAEHGQKIHPIKLINVKGANYPQGGDFWKKCSATVYGFPFGRPLARSSGKIVKYISTTGKLLN